MAGKVGWDGRVAVTEATGPNITMDGVTYKLLGLDENGSKVYQDVEVLKEQTKQAEERKEKNDSASATEDELPTQDFEQGERENSKNLYDATVVSPTVKTAKYRKLYNNLEEPVKIQRLVYQCAKEILQHRSGTKFEDMTYINTVTGGQLRIKGMETTLNVNYKNNGKVSRKESSRTTFQEDGPDVLTDGDYDATGNQNVINASVEIKAKENDRYYLIVRPDVGSL